MMLSSGRGIGLVAVIAVSGGVALIAFGRQKKLMFHENFKSKPSLPSDDSVSRGANTEIAERQEGNDARKQRILEFRPSQIISRLDFLKSCRKSNVFQDESKRKKRSVKRVRFSDDVVEPCGNGKEYRQRHMIAIRAHALLKTQEKDTYRRNEKRWERNKEPHKSVSELPANRKVLYNAVIQFQSQKRCLQYY